MVRRAVEAWITCALVGVAGCSAGTPERETNTTTGAVWPATLKAVGDGYPEAGAPCRVVGETAATVDLLDDSATLVGCPSPDQANALGGKVVATIEGITLVSVPRQTPSAGEGDGQADAKVAGTDYNATADIPCTLPDAAAQTCRAGVTRGPEQIAIEISLPGGSTRVLLFDGKGKFVTHGSAQADGSAALTSAATREEDWTIVTVGKETYRIPDAFVMGG